MFSDVQIINIGLSKIASSRISRIDPPTTSLERFVSENYEHWKRSEISKRRWVFALAEGVEVPLVEVLEGTDSPYKYALPTDCLRPVREKRSDWRQRGRFLLSATPDLKIIYIRNVPESEFDPLFVEALACRIALETCEFLTQSNTKKADAKALYDDAIAEGGKANAFVIGPEDIRSDDTHFSFVTGRF